MKKILVRLFFFRETLPKPFRVKSPCFSLWHCHLEADPKSSKINKIVPGSQRIVSGWKCSQPLIQHDTIVIWLKDWPNPVRKTYSSSESSWDFIAKIYFAESLPRARNATPRTTCRLLKHGCTWPDWRQISTVINTLSSLSPNAYNTIDRIDETR